MKGINTDKIIHVKLLSTHSMSHEKATSVDTTLQHILLFDRCLGHVRRFNENSITGKNFFKPKVLEKNKNVQSIPQN